MKIIATEKYAKLDYRVDVPVLSAKDYRSLQRELDDLCVDQYHAYSQLVGQRVLRDGPDGYLVAVSDPDSLPEWRRELLKEQFKKCSLKEKEFYDLFRETLGQDTLDELLYFRPDDVFLDEISQTPTLKQYQLDHQLWVDKVQLLKNMITGSMIAAVISGLHAIFLDGSTVFPSISALIALLAFSLRDKVISQCDARYELLVTAVKQAYPLERFKQTLDPAWVQPGYEERDVRQEPVIVDEADISPEGLKKIVKKPVVTSFINGYHVLPCKSFILGRRLNNFQVECRVFHLLPKTPVTDLDDRYDRIVRRFEQKLNKKDDFILAFSDWYE